jgi:hypothetical protein
MPDPFMNAGVMPTASSGAERRNYPRYPFTAAVQAVDTGQRTVLNARISDLGRGGCYIDAFSPFPVKTGVKLRITSEQRAFEAQANVVYSKTGMAWGWRSQLWNRNNSWCSIDGLRSWVARLPWN